MSKCKVVTLPNGDIELRPKDYRSGTYAFNAVKKFSQNASRRVYIQISDKDSNVVPLAEQNGFRYIGTGWIGAFFAKDDADCDGLKNIKNFIWDFDGTLYDTYPNTIKWFCQACDIIGIPYDKEEIYTCMMENIGVAFQLYQTRYILGNKLLEIYRTLRSYDAIMQGSPFPYARTLLKEIVDSGKRNFMFTHRHDDVHKMMNYWETEKYFTEIATLADGFKAKPSPDAILYLMEKYNLDPAETLMIGDREVDVLSGKNAGILTCHITNCLPYKLFDVNFRLNTLKEFYEIIKR